MLQIDTQGIDALTRHDLGGEAVGHGKPAKRCTSPGTPHLLDLVLSHGRISGLFFVPGTTGLGSIE